MPTILLDNDIVAKATAYSLLNEIEQVFSIQRNDIGVLGTVVFVIAPRRLRTAQDGGEDAHRRLKAFADQVSIMEPNEVESALAAELESSALKYGLQFDVGESQLCALAMSRNVRYLCTGDKRAIAAIEVLRAYEPSLIDLDRRILSLEAIIREINVIRGHEYVRQRVCASAGTDKAVEICFQCMQQEALADEIDACLIGYLQQTWHQAPAISAHL